MNDKKVLFVGDTVIIKRDDYINHWRNVVDMRNLLERAESMGDDMFQVHLLLGAVYLLTRSFGVIEPDNLEGAYRD